MRKIKKEVIEALGVSKHLQKDFRKDQPARVSCGVGSWPKKFDVEIGAIAVVDA